MAESADDPGLYWVEPEYRGIIPLNGLIVSHRLARTIRSDHYEIAIDRDFEAVIEGCAAPAAGRRSTWINKRIRKLYGELFALGHCHTVEAYREGRLVGGLYGVDLAGAFFGESMFHRERDASKVALAHLVARLRHGGYRLLDTQFVTEHLASLGALELPRTQYHLLLNNALQVDGDFLAWPRNETKSGAEILAELAG